MDNPQLLILVGPTGVGKTAVAIELCEMLNGEIISGDSMQIYRALDIGTAKATREEQKRARHHLIDIIDPPQEYSAAAWAHDARKAINDISARGKRAIIGGGTGFYIQALLSPQRLASAPPDAALRKSLEELAMRRGNELLHAQLKELDAEAAARLHPNDLKRVIRAIEVAFHAKANTIENKEQGAEAEYSFCAFGLTMPRELLYERINARVDKMLAAGFMDELRAMIEAGYGDALPLQSLGYKQMRRALDDPGLFDSCVEEWKRDTRRYAKRQLTWFRHQLTTHWIDVENQTPREIAECIANRIAQGSPEKC